MPSPWAASTWAAWRARSACRSIIGYLAAGLVLGPSALDLITEDLQRDLNFITDLALGSLAPASAPAGTVAVIRENEAFGTLTMALWQPFREIVLSIVLG